MKVKIVLSIMVLALLLPAVMEVYGQPVITSVDRKNGASNASGQLGPYDGNTDPFPMEEGGVKDGNLIRSDRSGHRFVNTPNGTLGPLNKPLIGSEYVRTFNNDKDAGGVNVTYEVTISMQATVWITMDDRWNATERQTRVDQVTSSFVSAGTFKDTGLKVYVGGDSDRPMSIYAAELGAGTYVFGPQQGNNFYTIGAVPGDPTFNPPPVVDAKPDGLVALYVDETLQLGGTVTDQDPQDGPAGQLSWQWSKLSGPGTVTFSDIHALDATATFSAKGDYQLMLWATDGDKDANDIVRVLVVDRADDKIMAHWNFEVVGGPFDVMDSVNKNHGTFVSADGNSLPAYVDGWIGSKALNFPGNSHVLVAIDSNSVPSFSSGPRTGASLSAWVQVDAFDTDWQTAVSRGDDSWRIARTSRTNDNRNAMAFHVSGVNTNPANGPSGTIGVNDGHWHHVAGTYDGKMIRLYIDGVLDVTQAANGLVNLSSNPIVLGGQIHNDVARRHWKGSLDDVRVYNYGLSEAEVLALTSMGFVPPMVRAGANQSVQYRPGEKLDLNGSVIDNGKQSAMSITWTTESGPNGAEAIFDDAASPVTKVSFPAFGVYVLALTAENSYTSTTDTVQITVSSPTCADVIAEGKLLLGDVSGPLGVPDCRVDFYDFVRMAEDWMRCNDPGAVECEYPY